MVSVRMNFAVMIKSCLINISIPGTRIFVATKAGRVDVIYCINTAIVNRIIDIGISFTGLIIRRNVSLLQIKGYINITQWIGILPHLGLFLELSTPHTFFHTEYPHMVHRQPAWPVLELHK